MMVVVKTRRLRREPGLEGERREGRWWSCSCCSLSRVVAECFWWAWCFWEGLVLLFVLWMKRLS